jgi:hypothetical protein
MKRFYLFLLSLTLLTGTAVQGQVPSFNGGDQIVAQGQPPLTQAMVDQLAEVFEWALGGQFTPTQREEFQRERVAEWQRADRQSIDNVLGFLKLREQIVALPEDKRAQAQPIIQAKLLEAIRQQPNDPTSQMLLAVYESGHRRDRRATSPAEQSQPQSAGYQNAAASTGVPPEMVGKWGTGRSYNLGYVNRTTGSWAPSSGTQVMYTIHPDGRYEYAALTQQSMYNCTTKLFTYKTGLVTVQGRSLVFTPKTGKFTSEDNCNAKNNYEKPADMEQEAYNWRIERDEVGLKFCLQGEGINGCAYKRD